MNKKYIQYAVIGGVVLVALYLLKRNKDQRRSDDNSGGGGGGGQESGNTGLPYAAMADEMFDAMNGYGTNETKINDNLNRLKNKADWNSLVSAYGVRKLSSGRGNVFASDFTGNLPNALISELSSSELKTANNILNKIGVSI